MLPWSTPTVSFADGILPWYGKTKALTTLLFSQTDGTRTAKPGVCFGVLWQADPVARPESRYPFYERPDALTGDGVGQDLVVVAGEEQVVFRAVAEFAIQLSVVGHPTAREGTRIANFWQLAALITTPSKARPA